MAELAALQGTHDATSDRVRANLGDCLGGTQCTGAGSRSQSFEVTSDSLEHPSAEGSVHPSFDAATRDGAGDEALAAPTLCQ